ncbi:type I methionyl aminopeptidase [Candidatus Woesebacteria bacterium]|nr:MAG: type I methionyl aminopeptidase [Candidatus Woesebacteria bacterium]
MHIKSDQEIKLMQEGGKLLAGVKNTLAECVSVGVSAWEIEEKARELIKKTGGEPSFMRVPGYHWATCINVNEGIVHGIPKKEVIFKKGDVVSVDVGLYYKGFHTDTSVSKGLGVDNTTKEFLLAGEKALDKAIGMAIPGNHVSDISRALQSTIEGAGYSPVRSLVGHGVGRELHEDPQIPCYVVGRSYRDEELLEGLVIAIEIMYAFGSYEIKLMPDKWTISTQDGTISALYEETVAVTKNGPLVLTRV